MFLLFYWKFLKYLPNFQNNFGIRIIHILTPNDLMNSLKYNLLTSQKTNV